MLGLGFTVLGCSTSGNADDSSAPVSSDTTPTSSNTDGSPTPQSPTPNSPSNDLPGNPSEGPVGPGDPPNGGGHGNPEPNPGAGGGGASGGTAVGGSGAMGESPDGADGGMPGTSGNGGSGGETPTIEDGDNYVSDVEVTVHEDVSTVLVVNWTQTTATDQVWLEFTFEDNNVMTSRAKSGETGEHQDFVLGIPENTAVNIRIVSSDEGTLHKTSEHNGTTEALPAGLPRPEVVAYDPERSTPEPWMVGSVEDSAGNLPSNYLFRTFWIYIMDRQGRIVWYYADPASNATSSFQRIARDGEYLWIEKRPFGQAGSRGVLKLTLDREYFEEIPVDGLADCIDVTTDGSLLYDANDEVREMSRDGSIRTIWSCPDHFGQGFNCYTNTINWNPEDDTILLSFPEPNTVIQLDRGTGDVVGQYGEAAGSWDFAPPLESPPNQWGFGFQHFPNISADGTLIISSHMPGYEDFNQTPTANQHAFIEFEIDRDNQQLVEVWRYTEGPEWARSRGMAIKLANGNYLGNYGTGGVIREVTPDKDTVFHVKFDLPEGDDFFNKLVGNTFFVDDLYSLSGGGPE